MAAPNDNPLIRKLAYLHPLSDLERELLDKACSRIVRVGPDQDLINEGDRPTECNLLLEGMTCRYKILSEGKRQIFSFHVPGDIYDAQSFVMEVMDHSVATLTPCTIAVIPHTTMVTITEEHPRLARAVWKDTLVDASIFREWMASIGRRSAYQRLAHLMCEIHARLDAVGLATGGRIDWPITQSEIGDALGLSLVHVNRTLQELRGAGLITLKESKLVILDLPGLKTAGDFDPQYLHMKARRSISDRTGDASEPRER